MTTSNDLDTVSNSWDEHSSHEHGGSPSQAGIQVAQAAQAAPAEPVPVDVGSGAPVQPAAPAEAKAPAAAAPHEYVADASNIVKLPADVSIDNIKVDGHNLLLEQADGSVILIKDGALNVPTFIIGDVEVPRVALLAALEASHVDVAFGADGSISAGPGGSNPSAGADFSVPPGGIGDGFDLSALLPPTDLAFGQPDHRELFPSLRPDSTPSIIDLTPSVEGGDTIVNEKGLPESPGPEGSGEASAPGVDGDISEHNTGTFTIASPDGVGSLTIAGQVISGAALANSASTPIDIITPLGNTLTVNGYDASTGQVSYSYTLVHSATHPDAGTDSIFDDMTVTVTDTDGDVSLPGTLSVQIVDDVPTAHDEASQSIAEGAPALTGTLDFVAGADGATVTHINGTALIFDAGTGYSQLIDIGAGTIQVKADGSYSFTPDASVDNSSGPVAVNATYTVTDGDLDTSTANIAFTITDGAAPVAGAPITLALDDQNLSDGSTPAGADFASNSITFTPGSDAMASIAFGTDLSGLNTANLTWTRVSDTQVVGNDGAVTVVTLDLAVANNVATVTATLNNNYDAHPSINADDLVDLGHLGVVATDTDGTQATGTVNVTVSDDVPTAVADIDSIGAGLFGPATGNVLVGGTDALDGNTTDGVADTKGADGAAVVGVVAGDTNAALDNTATLGVQIQGLYGKLTLAADGTYTYTRDAGSAGGHDDVFTYTIKDGDGDTSHTTLTISIGNSPPVITDLTPAANGGDVTVNEDDLLASRGVGESAGSDTSKESTTQGGTFTISSPDGIASLTIDGHAFITNGVFTASSFTTALGNTLNVTGYNPATGTVSYTYTLLDNEAHATGASTNSLFENLAVSLTDQDGQNATGTLSVNIVDDVPTAVADIDSIGAGLFGPATGNVLVG
ncbi:Ig-like domain-containing protein, partial [Mesorhizobium sp. M0292]|uniref:beta strand repeat-containing protein n=1 Tax=Mesorhizobium sp. M0292 TaxID=2956929 RepID=UPI0033392489